MRIRTIKPEFWEHPVMARQSDATKLLAIGLLNFADDEGYFYADPKLIRNAIRPLDDDSRITTVSLRELSEMGYVSVKKHEIYGDIGLVVSFAAHQVINKAKPSKIKHLWNTVSLPYCYGLEGKGKEGKGREDLETHLQAHAQPIIIEKKPSTSSQPASIEQAIAYGQTIGMSEAQVRTWHDKRAADEWMIHGANGVERHVKNWMLDMPTAKNWGQTRQANGKDGKPAPKGGNHAGIGRTEFVGDEF